MRKNIWIVCTLAFGLTAAGQQAAVGCSQSEGAVCKSADRVLSDLMNRPVQRLCCRHQPAPYRRQPFQNRTIAVTLNKLLRRDRR